MAGVHIRKRRTLPKQRSRMSATEEALLFAAGGDYRPARGPRDTHRLSEVPHTQGNLMDEGSVLDQEAENQIKELGRIRRERLKTVHRMGKIKKSLRNRKSSNTEIEMENMARVPTSSTSSDDTGQVSNISELKKESEVLQEVLDREDAELKSIQDKISTCPTVKSERLRASNPGTRDAFIKDIFSSVRDGDLDSLKMRVAALDLESPSDAGVKEIIDPCSHLPLLHVALMCHQPEIIKFLIQHAGPDLTMQSVSSGDCDNIRPFYIALLHGDLDVIRLLVESLPGAVDRSLMVNQVITRFNQADEEVEEWPLFNMFSASPEGMSKMKEIFDYLVDNGADLSNQTSDGDTLLHCVVRQSTKDTSRGIQFLRAVLQEIIIESVGKWWRKKMESEAKHPLPLDPQESRVQAMKYLLGIRNKANHTPVTLAVQCDSPLFIDFVQMENVMRFPDPKLGGFLNKTQTYDVTDIASLDPEGCYKKGSVLHIIAHNNVHLSKSKDNVDILDTEPLRSIVKMKWNTYRYAYYLMAIMHLVHMIVFTHVTFSHNDGGNLTCLTRADSYSPAYNIMHHMVFAGFLILPLLYIITEIIDLCSVRKTIIQCPAHGNVLFRGIAILFSLATIGWYLLHEFIKKIEAEYLSTTLLLGWVFMIFFTRGIILPWKHIQIGMFSSMLHRMFFFDVVPFAVMAFLMLISFSTAFHAFLLNNKLGTGGYQDTLYLMVKYLCGLPNPQDQKPSEGSVFAKLLLIVYGLITVVLLINMLIAAMNTSYEMIRSSKFNPIYRQRLSILLLFERRMPKCIRRRTQRTYTVKENPRTGRVEMFHSVKDIR